MMTELTGVITFGIIAGIGLFAWFVTTYAEKKGKPEVKRQEVSWGRILTEYRGKTCEIVVKEPLVNIDIMYSARGILKDLDDEWLELECEDKKGKVVKFLRLDQIKGVKEII